MMPCICSHTQQQHFVDVNDTLPRPIMLSDIQMPCAVFDCDCQDFDSEIEPGVPFHADYPQTQVDT